METTIKLEDLKPAEGSTHRTKRKGRGRASGHGKTSCRGHNGEGQRSGRSSKRGFEGGQMPGYRQMPKLKGFMVINQLNYAEINVGKLNEIDEKEINLETLVNLGLASKKADALRVLGSGELKKAVNVTARHFTQSAKEKIESAGGTIKVD